MHNICFKYIMQNIMNNIYMYMYMYNMYMYVYTL
jgi:hypothetical protein